VSQVGGAYYFLLPPLLEGMNFETLCQVHSFEQWQTIIISTSGVLCRII